jgi:hypothetical protein
LAFWGGFVLQLRKIFRTSNFGLRGPVRNLSIFKFVHNLPGPLLGRFYGCFWWTNTVNREKVGAVTVDRCSKVGYKRRLRLGDTVT